MIDFFIGIDFPIAKNMRLRAIFFPLQEFASLLRTQNWFEEKPN